MADISVQKKEGGDFTWVWAALAVVAIVGLMAWLLSTQDDVRSAAAGPEAADTTVEAGAAVDTVDIAAIQANPDQFAGRTVRVEQLPVSSSLGSRGFWAMAPDGSPLLVIVDPAVTDASWVRQGTTHAAQGTVRPVAGTDVNSWIQSGQISAEAQQQVGIARHYLLVTEVSH